jgi:hypothetical protein
MDRNRFGAVNRQTKIAVLRLKRDKLVPFCDGRRKIELRTSETKAPAVQF